MPHYKLTYFNVRGRAECVRMLFALNDTPFEDNRITFQDWPKHKPSTPFGAMPVLEVDGQEIPQTSAILRYLSTTLGKGGGENNYDDAIMDAIYDQIKDFGLEYGAWYVVEVGYRQGDKEQLYKDVWLPSRERNFKIFEKYLEENPSGWLVGPNITWADLGLATQFELVKRVSSHPEEFFDGFPLLKAHYDRACL